MGQCRVALVTGASSGIGRAVAKALLQHSFAVYGTGRSADRLQAVAAEEDGQRFSWSVADLTDAGVLTSLLNQAGSHFETSTSAVILSAGRGLRGTLLTSDPSEWPAVLEVNYLGLMHQMREAAQYMVQRADDNQVQDIVVIGSTVGRQLSSLNPVYGSTKFAIHSMVESLRQEICSKRVRVTLIEPGFVKSGFQDVAGYDRNWFETLEKESGPFLVPEDIAATIAFVVNQPAHVHLDDIRIRPTRQKV